MRVAGLFAVVATMSIATSVSAQSVPPPPAVGVAPVEPIGMFQQQPPTQAPLYVYQQQSKNRVGALTLEYFLPGMGCIYAGNPSAAFKTWVMTFGGAFVFLYGMYLSNQGFTGQAPGGMMLGGGISLAMGRILGLYDAWSSAADYNEGLRSGLGLVED